MTGSTARASSRTARETAPVFTVGSPRSGTTLLYHMLLSAGGFVRYRTETHVFSALAPRFGGMRSPDDIRRALDVWLQSDCHTLTTLPADAVRALIERECRSAGDFLRLIMEEMGRRQREPRWAETTPAHLLHMREISAQIPGALFVHVVRDGRDVAASLAKQGWIAPLPVDRERPVLAAAAYWNWLVREGRREGDALGDRYLEVKYEDLVDRPQETLARIGAFIAQPLDHAEIQRVGIGSVGRPNTSFPDAKG
ncbi:MAG TPA: sulfotransferase, partial [Gemmatimonadaceae bacterium]|nr:sulfotransferase [Gemmatimonadaceae bacterium]